MRIYTILVNGEKVLPQAYKTYGEALECILCPLDKRLGKGLSVVNDLGQGLFVVNDTTYQITECYVED